MSDRVDTTSTEHGIQVRAEPRFLAEQSDPSLGRFVFGYRITISNHGDRAAKLVSRHWIVVDADAQRHIVRGEGVIGRQPVIAPGTGFTYSSFCPLATAWGTMEGTYLMEREDGELFEVDIPRFYLAGPGSP